MSIESPLIGSGSQEEVELRVNALIDQGKSRGFLTYEELNERLPDEVVSPDKLDSLLMMIDEMGIRLIDEADVGEYTKAPKPRVRKPAPAPAADGKPEKSGKGRGKDAKPEVGPDGEVIEAEDGEEIDLNLEEEIAEAATKRIDDPVRMYLTQMGEIPLLTREQEISLAKRIEIFR